MRFIFIPSIKDVVSVVTYVKNSPRARAISINILWIAFMIGSAFVISTFVTRHQIHIHRLSFHDYMRQIANADIQEVMDYGFHKSSVDLVQRDSVSGAVSVDGQFNKSMDQLIHDLITSNKISIADLKISAIMLHECQLTRWAFKIDDPIHNAKVAARFKICNASRLTRIESSLRYSIASIDYVMNHNISHVLRYYLLYTNNQCAGGQHRIYAEIYPSNISSFNAKAYGLRHGTVYIIEYKKMFYLFSSIKALAVHNGYLYINVNHIGDKKLHNQNEYFYLSTFRKLSLSEFKNYDGGYLYSFLEKQRRL